MKTKNHHQCTMRMTFSIDNILTGEKARSERKRFGKSLREIGNRLGFSASYLSDLELGRKNWNDKLLNQYMLAVHGCPKPPTIKQMRAAKERKSK